MTGREIEVLEKAIDILKENLNPDKIILFGSRANGKHGKNADFDLAVDIVKPDNRTRRLITEKIDEETGLYSFDIVYLSSVDKNFKDLVLKTGKILYER
ncbi:MAG: nucleotidyltransferase domain-containing protein [Ignavibacteria bacterium]